MSDSRERILAAVRAGVIDRRSRPTGVPQPLSFPDPVRAFERSLADAGGECIRVASSAELPAALESLGRPREASRIWCRLGLGLPAPQPPESLRALSDLELAVLPGQVPVAESGAVWVTPADRAERGAAFLAERLVLVVPARSLVHELHQAYAQIDPAAHAFGCFIAGPSKTADIEQALVIGAHGPRSLCVLLYEGPDLSA